MKIRLFRSGAGGCLLLEARSGHRMLFDGGTAATMRDVVAPALARLGASGPEDEAVHLVCVSRPHEDYLGGVLALLETALLWRVHDYHAARGDPVAGAPDAPRVPRIGAVWHNALHAQLAADGSQAYALLANGARALRSSHVPRLEGLGREFASIANAIPQSLRLTRLLRRDLLDIPLNQPVDWPVEAPVEAPMDAPVEARTDTARDEPLMTAGPDAAVHRLGPLRLRVLCPTEPELARRRDDWCRWLRDPGNRIRGDAMRERYGANVLGMAQGRPGNPFDLRDWEGTAAYRRFAIPRIPSLALHVEEDGRTVLLAGDARPDTLLAALEQAGLLEDDALHVDALQVWHHGMPDDMTAAFAHAVSADHYLFGCNSTGGTDGAPAVPLLDAFVASRTGTATGHARHPRADGRPYTFWFSTTSAAQMQQANIAHMEQVERWAEAAVREHGPRLRVRFVERDHATVALR